MIRPENVGPSPEFSGCRHKLPTSVAIIYSTHCHDCLLIIFLMQCSFTPNLTVRAFLRIPICDNFRTSLTSASLNFGDPRSLGVQ